MKKLVALVVILLMTSVASADLLLSINGDTACEEITVTPSTNVEIDLEVGVDHYNQGYDLDLVISNDQAVWIEPTWSTSGVPPVGSWSGIEFPTDYTLTSSTVNGSSSSVVRIMGVMKSTDYAYPEAVIMQKLYLHCEEGTDVTVSLVVHDADGMRTYDASDSGWAEVGYTDGQILDTVTIHQVPEPATLALLGLGGLLLRRRR